MNQRPSHLSPVAYLNGAFVPFEEARLPIYDLGIVQGASVTERLRTVRHEPYLVQEHLERLQQSLAVVGWGMPQDLGPMAEVIARVAHSHAAIIPANADLSVVIFVTAGQALGDAQGLVRKSRPSVCVYSSPLPLASYAEGYRRGVHLVTPAVRQLPADVVSPHVKMRSRLHWYLAEQQAHQQDPTATALLLDHHNFVTETASGNLFVLRKNALHTPRAETTLAGIAQSHVIGLAERLGWSVRRSDLSVEDVAGADEAFLTSSTYCILPVGSINGRAIGRGVPGALTKALLDNWSEEIGLDLERQCFSAAES